MTAKAPEDTQQRKTLVAASLAHALHDGYTDMIYVLLPIWQTEFAIGYGVLALLRGLYAGTMASLQITAGPLAKRFGGRLVLALGTLLAALGYFIAGCSTGLIGLGIALTIAGAGSSMQHPLASTAVSVAYGSKARKPLGIYNFGGDIGKAALPAILSLLLIICSWRESLWLFAAAGALAALTLWRLLPSLSHLAINNAKTGQTGSNRGGFSLLLSIGVLDSATRMGFLTFLPFILKDKGAAMPEIGLGLSLVFIGGAAGKFICGWLGERMGVLYTVLATEGGTTAAILLILALPLFPSLAILPLLGLMLNGTSSVLYGTVPELTATDKVTHAFSLFYTGTIGAGAIAPVLYGLLGDMTSPTTATIATVLTALLTLPLAVALARHLPTQTKTSE